MLRAQQQKTMREVLQEQTTRGEVQQRETLRAQPQQQQSLVKQRPRRVQQLEGGSAQESQGRQRHAHQMQHRR